jgi:rod shape-determining protein MreD
VKTAVVLLGIMLALALQTTVAPFLLAGGVGVDLVLVVVVWTALQFGPAIGLLSGATAGLAQDALSGGIIGVGGLSKTLVGFIAGVIGSQFIVTNALPRFFVLFAGAALHGVVFLGLYSIIDRRGFVVPWRSALIQALLTAVVGIVLMMAASTLPGMRERRRLRRGY